MSQVSVYSLAAMSPAMMVRVGPRAVSPRRKNVRGALANVHEWSPSLLSPSFVEQVARQFVEFVEFEYYCAHAGEKFADLKFTVIARSTGHANNTRRAQ